MTPAPEFDDHAKVASVKAEIVLVAAGIVSHSKLPERVIGLVGALAPDLDVMAVFAGSVPPDYHAELQKRSTDLGVGERVRFVGRTDQFTYWNLLRSADIAIQLRAISTGGGSAALGDCLAAGTPVVTTAELAEELPQGTVVVADLFESGSLEAAVRGLISSEEHRHRLAEAGLEWVAARPMSRVVDELLNVVTDLTPQPPTERSAATRL
jgi:glycosyltransferase involved in cell wall biosynthesis